MFCKNCGKEILDNASFCPACGTSVKINTADMGNIGTMSGTMPERGAGGICTTGKYDTVRKMTEQFAKEKKKFQTIATIVSVIYAYFIVRSILEGINSILAGNEEIAEFVLSIGSIILFACGLLYLVVQFGLPDVVDKKLMLAEEYIKCIYVNDKDALVVALRNMQCSAIKNIYMDEHGNVCVVGKKGTHVFMVQDGQLLSQTDMFNYKVGLEQETIVACLLKFLDMEAPINAYRTEKHNKWLSRVKMMLAAVALASGMVFVVFVLIDQMGKNYIDMVKKSSPELYPDITYGEAFDNFFADCKWKYFKSDDKQNVVEFNGNCMYGEDEAQIKIQFIVSDEENTVELYTVGIDGEAQPALVQIVLLEKVFNSYGENGEEGELQLDGDISTQEEFLEEPADLDDRTDETRETDKSDMPEVMEFAASYTRTHAPSCGLAIISISDVGVNFSIAVGTSGENAYVDLPDLTAEWIDDNVAVYKDGDYQIEMTMEENSIILRENKPCVYNADVPLTGTYINDDEIEASSEFIFPETDIYELTPEDLEGKNATECKIARNEIYAWHGRMFKDEQLQGYFDTCIWYIGLIEAEDFSEDVLNGVERANLKKIADYEKRMGY